MNFNNKSILRTFTSPDSKNSWAFIESVGWKKVSPSSEDGVTNISIMLNAAFAHGRKVTGVIDGSDQLSALFLL